MKIPAILSWRFRDQDCYVRTAGAPYVMTHNGHFLTIAKEATAIKVEAGFHQKIEYY